MRVQLLCPRSVVPGGRQYRKENVYTEAQLIGFLSQRIVGLPGNRFGTKVILIAGSSGVGKTTLAGMLGNSAVSAVRIDLSRWRGPFVNPNPTEEELFQVLGLQQMINDLSRFLSEGKIYLPKLAHYVSFCEKGEQTGIRESEEDPILLADVKLLLIDSYLAFLLEPIFRELNPLKIFLAAGAPVRLANKALRGDKCQPRINKPQSVIKIFFQQEREAHIQPASATVVN